MRSEFFKEIEKSRERFYDLTMGPIPIVINHTEEIELSKQPKGKNKLKPEKLDTSERRSGILRDFVEKISQDYFSI
ncbi:MAG: hypothetical protein Q7J34_11125 [Bacteroidales bacterium]|nr:hypothetical protein [Bacteroidales bacterium]